MKMHPPSSILSKLMGHGLLLAKHWLDHASSYSTTPFDQSQMILPRVDEKYYSWTHYGIIFPSLPEPFRYLNIMLLLGTPSALAFDHDDMIASRPRKTATLFSSTAVQDQRILKAYIIPADTEIDPQGHYLKFAQQLEISGTFPNIRVQGKYAELAFDFQLKVNDQASWFIKTPVFDYFSLLAEYVGELHYQDQNIIVQGLCSYDYARAAGLHSVLTSRIEDQYKIPLDFFSYHIINLNSETQMLLTEVKLLNKSAISTVYIRHLNRSAEIFHDVSFKVIAHHVDDFIAPDGNKMRLPKIITWQANDQCGNAFFEIYARVDSPYQYGYGRGYASSYSYTGQYHGHQIQGRACMQYINIENQADFLEEEISVA